MHRFKDWISMIQQKWNDWDKLEQRCSKTPKRQLEEGLQAARYRRSARAEWEPTACRRSSSRRDRGAARSGWDSRTWCILGSRNEGPSRDWAWLRLHGKEEEWVERPSLAITAMLSLDFACVFRLSVSMRKVASEHPFCVLIYMNSYIFHIYFILFIFLWITHLEIWFYMLDVVIGRHTWNCQIRTHIHTKIHTHTHNNQKISRKSRKKKEKAGHYRYLVLGPRLHPLYMIGGVQFAISRVPVYTAISNF